MKRSSLSPSAPALETAWEASPALAVSSAICALRELPALTGDYSLTARQSTVRRRPGQTEAQAESSVPPPALNRKETVAGSPISGAD